MVKNILRKKRGFTLIELLVVIAVVGVLAGAVIVMINPAQQLARARDAQRKSDLRQIANALEEYVIVNGSYPSTGGSWYSTCTGWVQKGRTGANGYVPNLAPTYMKNLPVDPKRGDSTSALTHEPSGYSGIGAYCYIYRSNGTDYKIGVHCGGESEQTPSSSPFYVGNGGAWTCGLWNMAIYTPGAAGW